jgi:hypothetical protein
LNRIEQKIIAEGLRQKRNSAALHRSPACFPVPVCGDEDNWNPMARSGKLALKFQSIHAWHLNIHDQAGRFGEEGRLQEALCRVKSRGSKVKGLEKSYCRSADRLIIIDN